MPRPLTAYVDGAPVSPVAPATAFDRLAPAWDTAHGPWSPRCIGFALRAALLRDLVERLPRCRVLDVGCGTGQYLLALAGSIEEGVGVDISAGMIERARGNAARSSLGARLRFAVLDGERLEHAIPGRFDVVTFYGSLEHIGRPDDAIGQATALLCRGGLLVVATLHPWHPCGLLARRGARRGTIPHVRLFRRRDLRAWATGCGLVGLPLRFAAPAGWTGASCRFWLRWLIVGALMPAFFGNLVLVFRRPMDEEPS